MNLDTPYQFLKYLWTDEIINNIYEESKRYAIQKNPSKPLTLSENEINQCLCICIFASLVHLPNCRAYWSEELGFDQIKETMSLKKFETIGQYLHFNDNHKHLPRNHSNHDRLHKIRPLYDELNKNFAKVPLERHLSIDEQICSTKVRHYMKQYLPMKSHKWRFKFFVLCGISAHLSKEGIYSLEIINRNRIPNSKIPTEEVFNKMERGHSMEFVGNYNDIEISVTARKDSKTVVMASTFAGEKPLGKVMRCDKKTKNRV
ncbi:piggyBac transposable element-derived protein 1 [Nephila pilipes]|uniref:PiggyBac transposable element-derived protein 1 n=1 Tax=Nephila pilipes TaxID=299642 RepID=A0A8X6TCA0_NEPPI|nr:piggyBac transposable element-derived protein 1 [Nephila pilipes]